MMSQNAGHAGTSSKGLNSNQSFTDMLTSKNSKVKGGGGADMFHGFAYHVGVVMLLLFSLKNISVDDLGFQYEISLEKEGYGKFDDIVLKYKLSEGQWVELCIQCKHAADTNAKITAEDFVGKEIKTDKKTKAVTERIKNKTFHLFQFIETFKTIKNLKETPDKNIKRFVIILCNRQYDSSKDGAYNFFQRTCSLTQDFSELSQFLTGDALTIKINNDFMQNVTGEKNLEESDFKEFCESFVYICDNRDISKEIEKIALTYCDDNQEESRNLVARLKSFVYDNLEKHKNPLSICCISQIFSKKQVTYQLPSLSDSFIGRDDELQILNEALESNGKKMLDVLVTGLPGVGKTQFVTKYIENNLSKFTNVIWINAETENSIETSFVELAVKCSLIKSDTKMAVKKIIEAVYEYLSLNSLFIFDNADHFEIKNKILLKQENNCWCYLPNKKHGKMQILVISQNKQWSCTNTINVNCLSPEDAFKYMKDAIDNKCEYSDDDINTLTCKLNYWPLALSLAASFIKQEIEDSLLNPVKLPEITNKIYKKEAKFEHFKHNAPHMELYNNSVYAIWQLLKEKLKKSNSDAVIIQILEVIAFTEPDCIPFKLLLSHYSETEVKLCFKVATSYSIVSKHQNSFSIHRTIQFIIRTSLEKEKYEEVLELGNTIVCQYLESLDVYELRQMSTNIHCIAIWNHILESDNAFFKCYKNLEQISFKLQESHDVILGIKFLCKVIQNLNTITEIEPRITIRTNQSYAILLNDIGRCEQALEILISNLDIGDRKNTNCPDKMSSMQYNTAVLLNIEKYKETQNLSSLEIDLRIETLKADGFETLTTMQIIAIVLQNLGHYQNALKIFSNVLEVKKDKLEADHPDTLNTMQNMALVLDSIGIYDEALSLYDQVLEVEIDKLGVDHPSTLTTMNNKAIVLNEMGKYDDALSLYDQVLEVEVDKLGADNSSTLTTMHNKALVLANMGKYEDALNLYDQVLEMLTDKLGAVHPSTLTTMHSKASVLDKIGKYDNALSLYDQVLEVRKLKLGADHTSTLTTMHNKASVLDSMGKYDDALSIYDQVLEVRKVKLGADHPNTLTSMQNKASLLDKMGIYDDALSLYNEVIKAQIDKIGADHPNTLTTINNKASVLVKMGKYDDALSLYDQILKVRKDKLGANHPDTLTIMHNKASVLDTMGKYDDALSLYNQVLEVITVNLGSDHPSTLTTMQNKASLLDKMGIYDDALSLYNEVIKAQIDKIGADHPDTLTTMHNKALVLDNMGKYDDALSLYDQVMEVKELKLGADHPSTLTTMHNKASVLDNMGKYDNALSLYDQVLKLSTAKLGADHPSTLTTMHNKALVLDNMGKYDDALSLLNQVLEVREVKLGADHPYTQTTIKNKNVVLRKMRSITIDL